MKLVGDRAVRSTHPVLRRALVLLAFPALAAQADIVETLDGRTLHGSLKLASGGALMITPSNGPPEAIALTNLFRADFTSPTNRSTPRSGGQLTPAVIDEARGALPSPWQNRDVGRVETRGDAIHYDGTFTLAGGHRTRRGPEDGFHFVYQSLRGDGEIVARVASVEPRDQKERQARAGVLMRASLEPHSLSVLMSVSGGLGTYFRKWGKATESPAQDRRTAFNPPYWVKLVREGRRFAGYQSTDGRAWRLLAETTAPMPERLFVGLAMINARKGEVARASFDHVALGARTLAGRFIPKVVLCDGTVIADPFRTVDDNGVTFSGDKKGLAVPTANVARLLFQEIDDQQMPSGRAGVLLRNGDFIDGEFRGVENGRVKISSVLFGQRSYELKNNVTAVVLRNLAPQPVAFELRTLDGSVWRGKSLAVEAGAAFVNAPLIGVWRIAAEELVEIRRGGAIQTAAGAKVARP